jgi:hypothetical protein
MPIVPRRRIKMLATCLPLHNLYNGVGPSHTYE